MDYGDAAAVASTVSTRAFDGVVTADGSCASGSWQVSDASGGWTGCLTPQS